jgi:hypothetical protein
MNPNWHREFEILKQVKGGVEGQPEDEDLTIAYKALRNHALHSLSGIHFCHSPLLTPPQLYWSFAVVLVCQTDSHFRTFASDVRHFPLL